jgi:hypothetical protein
MTTERGVDTPSTPSRRTIIRGAAAAGVVAWTAPAIVDSLSSPAAAASLAGCFRAEFVRSTSSGCGTFVRSSPAANGSGCFDPSVWNNLPDYTGTITLTPSLPPGGPCLYTLAIDASSGCKIDSRSAARDDQGNSCSTGTLASGCQTMFFSPTFLPDRFKVLISCGGSLCTGGVSCPPV